MISRLAKEIEELQKEIVTKETNITALKTAVRFSIIIIMIITIVINIVIIVIIIISQWLLQVKPG